MPFGVVQNIVMFTLSLIICAYIIFLSIAHTPQNMKRYSYHTLDSAVSESGNCSKYIVIFCTFQLSSSSFSWVLALLCLPHFCVYDTELVIYSVSLLSYFLGQLDPSIAMVLFDVSTVNINFRNCSTFLDSLF